MHTPPTTAYSGLTLILDKPSRFDLDNKRLLAGPAGVWMENEVLGFPLSGVDIRDLESCNKPLLEGSKYIALLGPQSAERFGNGIGQHGYPLIVKSCLATAAFFPQDCCDHRNIEGTGDDDDENEASERETKDAAPTKRANHRFWTKWHVQKLLGKWKDEAKIKIKAYPVLSELNKMISVLRDTTLYLDIETSRFHRNLSCIGISWEEIWPQIYVIPVYRTTGQRAYQDFWRFHAALSLAFSRNTVVAHNAMFDLFILHAFFKFSLPRNVYCTMLANHRCFPEIEKSLGHLIAQWTHQHYHKDQNTEVYNKAQEEQLWNYNARDVYALKLIKDAQTSYSKDNPGLIASIRQANESLVPYLVNSCQGLRLDQQALVESSNMLGRHADVFRKIAGILVGKPFNPGSAKQCKDFFHGELNYPVVTKGLDGPKLGSKQLYQLMIKTGNPLIPVILKYRKAAKDKSMLESELWTAT